MQAAIKAKQIADERKGLQDQLDSATMTSAQLLEKQRNALDETNRALFDQVQAAQAAAAAMAAMKSALDGLANTKVSLQQQLLTAQGKPLEALQLKRDTELAAALDGKTGDAIAKIAAAVKANWDLEDAISAQTAANQAAADAANAAATAASNAASAAASLKSAWQSLTDTIYAEVQRIRGLMNGGNNAASLAQLQAQFAIETAKARAGDQDAAKLLPSISKDLLDMQATQATTALDLMRAQAQTAASLEATVRILHDQYGLTIPGFAAGGDHAGGWRMVGEHGPEIEATGPSRIFDAATTASMLRSGGSDEEGLTVHELRMIRMALEQVAINTSRTNKFLDKVIVPAPTSGEIAITTRTVS